MKQFEKRAFQIVGVAAAVAVAGLLSPKAAHAVAAALVQVTNTFSSPAIVLPTNHAGAALVTLVTPESGSIDSGQTQALVLFAPGVGPNAAAYVVPTGFYLVVTGMDVTPATSGANQVTLNERTPADIGVAYLTAPTTATVQARYPGIVYPANTSISVAYSGPNSVNVTVYGYLTAM
jgi:hypothetical protein